MQLFRLLLNQGPLLEERTAQLRKEQRNPRLKRPAHRSFSGPPFCCTFPTPTVPCSGAGGRGGGGARGPARLRGNKARRGSSRPRSERVTKAGRRCQAPRQRSYGWAGRRPLKWMRFAPRFFWTSVFLSCVPKDLLGDSAFMSLVQQPQRPPTSLVPSPISSISPSFFLHLTPFTSAPSRFEG